MFKSIVCDPDAKQYEGNCMGLLYTALSRATTLGDDNGLNSAIYFTGTNLTYDRIKNLYRRKYTNEDYKKVKIRREWVNHLNRNTKREPEILPIYLEKTLSWAENHRESPLSLYDRIQLYVYSRKTSRKRKRES